MTWLYSAEDAAAAERHFDRVFVQRGVPEEIEDARFECVEGMVHLPGVMASELGMSRSEARRLIEHFGVRHAASHPQDNHRVGRSRFCLGRSCIGQ